MIVVTKCSGAVGKIHGHIRVLGIPAMHSPLPIGQVGVQSLQASAAQQCTEVLLSLIHI